MLWGYPCVDAELRHKVPQLLIAHFVDGHTLHGFCAVTQNTDFTGNGRRSDLMVASDHTDVDQAKLRQILRDDPDLNREAAKAMLWCDEKDITTRDSDLDELLASSDTRISRYQMTSFLFYLCTYELDMGSWTHGGTALDRNGLL